MNPSVSNEGWRHFGTARGYESSEFSIPILGRVPTLGTNFFAPVPYQNQAKVSNFVGCNPYRMQHLIPFISLPTVTK
jgi:hypothetical protein